MSLGGYSGSAQLGCAVERSATTGTAESASCKVQVGRGAQVARRDDGGTIMSTRVAIHGLGRIGRAVAKLVLERPWLDLVAVNDRRSVRVDPGEALPGS
jgi:glutamate dehydrogenase/leucine dehydrogenase